MTLQQIKEAVNQGKTVHWSNKGYRVFKDNLDQWFILCDQNQYMIGLTWRDNVTLNGKPEQFFLAE